MRCSWRCPGPLPTACCPVAAPGTLSAPGSWMPAASILPPAHRLLRAPSCVPSCARCPLPAGSRISLAARNFILNAIGGQYIERWPTLENELLLGRRELSYFDRIQLTTFKLSNSCAVCSLCPLARSVQVSRSVCTCMYASCMMASDVDLNVLYRADL